MRSLVRSAALDRAADRPPRYRHQAKNRVRPSGATLIRPPPRVTPALWATSQAEAPARTAPEAPPKVAPSQPITATAAQVSRPVSRQAPAEITADTSNGLVWAAISDVGVSPPRAPGRLSMSVIWVPSSPRAPAPLVLTRRM